MTGRDDVYRAETFEEHMHPDIHWLPNPEFDKAFDQIIEEDPPMEAALTKTDSYYPGYISAKADERSIILTVRGDAKQAPHGDGTALQAGEVVELRLTQDEMFDWLSQAMRLRVEEPHPSLFVEEPENTAAMKPAQDPASTGRSLRDELEERDHNGGYTVAEERAGYAEFPNEPDNTLEMSEEEQASMRDTLDVIDDKDSVLELTEDDMLVGDEPDDTRPSPDA